MAPGKGALLAAAARTLIVKAIQPIDARALVVPAEDEEVLRVLDLVGEQQADGLERLLAAVDVVAEKEVVCLWREAAVLEQAEEVVVLAVYVACGPGAVQRPRGVVTDKNT